MLLFLSHSSVDTENARALASRLKISVPGLEVWFDEKDLKGGLPWQRQIEAAIARSSAFAVYVGSRGVVNWVEFEVRVALDRAVTQPDYRFIPILANGIIKLDVLPSFARQYQAVREGAFEELVAAVAGGQGVGPSLETDPFFGLRAIDESRSHLFFGREAESEELARRVFDHSLVLVSGDSGSGKSSLVRAGLVPRFRGGILSEIKGERPGDYIWHSVMMRPRGRPWDELGDAVEDAARSLGLSIPECDAFARAAETRDPGQARRALRCGLPPERTVVLLIVDQFEELFTATCKDDRSSFVQWLLSLTTPPDERYRVVLTMRHDYVNLCGSIEGLRERLDANDRRARFVLGRVSDEGLSRIITEPLRLAGVDTASRDLLARVVQEEVGSRPGDLALVQMALTETWRAKAVHQGNLLSAYAAVGRVEGSLAKAAEQFRNSELSAPGNSDLGPLLDPVLVRLVRLGDTGGATRRQATRDEFDDARWRLIQLMGSDAGRRLVQLGGSDERPTAEIAHEALVTAWPHLQNLMQSVANDKRVLDQLITKAHAWLSVPVTDRSARLAVGAELEVFDVLQRTHDDWLSPAEREFIAASREQARRRRKKDRLVHVAAWATAAVLAAMLGAIGYLAVGQYRQLQISESRRLAAEAQRVLPRDRALALDMALDAWSASRTVEAREAIVSSFPHVAATFQGRVGPLNLANFSRDGTRIHLIGARGYGGTWSVPGRLDERSGPALSFSGDLAYCTDDRWFVHSPPGSPTQVVESATGKVVATLEEQTVSVSLASFSDSGHMLATLDAQDVARVWRIPEGEMVELKGHVKRVRFVALSRDGSKAFTGSTDDTGGIWNALTGERTATLTGHDGSVTFVVESPDQRLLLTSGDETPRIWNASSGQGLNALVGHTSSVLDGAFSADSKRVVTASVDQTAILWNATSGQRIATLQGHAGPVKFARFSPDGEWIVTASENEAHVWSGRTGIFLATLSGHQGIVWSAMFSPDGSQIVTTSDDGTARVWLLTSAALTAVLEHDSTKGFATFSPDGRHVLTPGRSNTIQAWTTDTAQSVLSLVGHTAAPLGAVYSPDGKRIVTTSEDKTARIWDASSGALLRVLGHDSPLGAATFSLDGLSVITTGQSRARVWTAADGKMLVSREVKGLGSIGAASSDAKLLLTTGIFEPARLVNMADGSPIATLLEKSSRDGAAAFSPRGDRVVFCRTGGVPLLFSVPSGKPIAKLGGPSVVTHVAFSDDGERVVLTDSSGGARVWNAVDGTERAILDGPSETVWHAAFSQDARRLVTSSTVDARVWAVADGTLLAVVLGHNGLIYQSALSNDGQMVATAGSDRKVRLHRFLSLKSIEGLFRQ